MAYTSSMFWPYQNSTPSSNYDDDNYDYNCNYNYNYNYMYPSNSNSSSSSSSSVDCTLSLGTPSTRLSSNENSKQSSTAHHRNSVSSFCWDLLGHHPSSTPSAAKPNRTAAAPTTADPLLARRCANCDTTSTPLWRNGPRGPKSLCNACGIRFKKEERRAAAATTTAAPTMDSAAHNGYSWGGHQYTQGAPQKMQCYSGVPNEFRFMEDVDRGTDSAGIQFLSWLTHDRPSGLVHDFTR